MPPKHQEKTIREAVSRSSVADIAEAPDDGSLVPASSFGVRSHARPEDEEITETRETTSQNKQNPVSKIFDIDTALVFALLLCASLLIGSPLPLLLFPLFLMAKSYAKDSSHSSKETVTKTVRRHSEGKGQERALKQARDEVQSRPEIGAQDRQQTQPIQLSPQIHIDANNLIERLQKLADEMARAKNDGDRKKLAQDFTRNITNNYNNIYSTGAAGQVSPQTRTEVKGMTQRAEQFAGASEVQRARMAPELMERLASLSQNQDFRSFITNIQGAAGKGATHIHNHTHKHFHRTKNLSREELESIVKGIMSQLPPAALQAQGGVRGAHSDAENQDLRDNIIRLQNETEALRRQLEAAGKSRKGVDGGSQTAEISTEASHVQGRRQTAEPIGTQTEEVAAIAGVDPRAVAAFIRSKSITVGDGFTQTELPDAGTDIAGLTPAPKRGHEIAIGDETPLWPLTPAGGRDTGGGGGIGRPADPAPAGGRGGFGGGPIRPPVNQGGSSSIHANLSGVTGDPIGIRYTGQNPEPPSRHQDADAAKKDLTQKAREQGAEAAARRKAEEAARRNAAAHPPAGSNQAVASSSRAVQAKDGEGRTTFATVSPRGKQR